MSISYFGIGALNTQLVKISMDSIGAVGQWYLINCSYGSARKLKPSKLLQLVG